MRIVYLLCFFSALLSCSKHQFITNAQVKMDNNICIILSEAQPNNYYVWTHYALYPDKKDDVFYNYKISDFFNIENIDCKDGKAEIKNMDISFTGKSTSGSKGERVGIFKYTAEVSFINHKKEVIDKIYTTESRSSPYNWNFQKTIRNLHSVAFSQGLREIQSMIEIDWQRLNRVK